MSWMERMFYFGLALGCYITGRWQSENRELINNTLRAKEFAIAINENRIDDIQYRLQDEVSVATFNSYNRFSFGPDLWQKPLPKGPVKVVFTKALSHTPSSPAPQSTTTTSNPPPTPSKPPTTTFVTPPTPSTEPVKEETPSPKTEPDPETTTPAQASENTSP